MSLPCFCGFRGKKMSNTRLRFYTITDRYVKFLREIDSKVQLNYPQPLIKPYVGVLLEINGHQYFAPMSSYKPHKYDKVNNNTIHKVIVPEDRQPKKSVIHLNNMIPIIQSEIEPVDFNQLEDKYKNLFRKEYRVVTRDQERIKEKALKLYNDVMAGSEFYCKHSCDFAKLESEYMKFVQ